MSIQYKMNYVIKVLILLAVVLAVPFALVCLLVLVRSRYPGGSVYRPKLLLRHLRDHLQLGSCVRVSPVCPKEVP